MSETWYAKPDDLVGGWCVMNVDLTPGEISDRGVLWARENNALYIAGFTNEKNAKMIAALHNAANDVEAGP